MSAANLYRTVNTAWTEGRLDNILQRQKELSALHANIKNSASALVDAVSHDLVTTEQSVAEEVRQTLDAIKHLYDSLDFPDSLRKERSIKKGNSVLEDLVPLGPSLIDPDPKLPISSTLIPLAAAVSAGSATVVLAPSGDSSLPSVELIRNIVRESLDVEAIAITADASSETREQLVSNYFAVAVLQNKEAQEFMVQRLTRVNYSTRILAPPSGIPAIFVDRTAQDLEAVAAHLRTGILRSPQRDVFRTLRICFVDEFIIERLADLLDRGGTTGQKALEKPSTSGNDSQALQIKLKALFPSLRNDVSGAPFGPVIQLSTKDPITPENIKEIAGYLTASTGELVLVPVTSLDNGIDLFNKVNRPEFSQAVYIFGESRSSFYISKFTNSLHVFINQIPAGSLLPLSPSSPVISFGLPYHRQDFSVGKSILQAPLTQPHEYVFRAAQHRLNSSKSYQPKGGSLSFFEQGLLVGLAVILATISGFSYVGIRGARYYWK
ncbi:hypothetical protein F4678DRAFT_40834 [Xylaria arbuscula]|nr:hypothetical protein F4678DRAFT_40834 [Xylaria arbuscula]